MAAPTTNLDRTRTVTLVNPTPPTNYTQNYQGSPPTPSGLAAAQADTAQQFDLFADPLNGATAPDLSGKSEADGSENVKSTPSGRVTNHSVLGAYTESPNMDHPSHGHLPYGPENVGGGAFGSATGWTLTNGATISGGTLNLDGTAAGSALMTSAQTIVAGTYHYEFDVIATNGAMRISVLIGGSSYLVPGSDVPGHFSGNMTTLASNQQVGIGSGTGCICTLDNLTIKKV